MKDGTSDVGGQKGGRDGERCLRNAEGKKTEEGKKKNTKSRARKRHTRGGKSILCLEERPTPKVQLC